MSIETTRTESSRIKKMNCILSNNNFAAVLARVLDIPKVHFIPVFTLPFI